MDRRVLASLLAAPLLLAGCISATDQLDPQAAANLGALIPDAPLWNDAQNTPHPLYNWPTLSSPAVGGTVPTWWTPIPAKALPDPVKGMEHVAKAEIPSGAGIALFGSLAVVPGFGKPTHVLDISDPASPKVLSEITSEDGAHRGAAFIAYPDGRLVFIVSTPQTVAAYDITDPTMPVKLPNLPIKGSHKVGVVPGTPIVYNANSRGAAGAPITDANTGKGNGVIEIVDMTDPMNPVLVQAFKNGYGCHQIYFWNSAEKQRAICAGIQFTQILDIKDPLAPEIIVDVPVHHGNTALPSTSPPGAVAFSHFSILNDDGTVLIVGDETGGGGAAACDGPGPLGNLWFYDVKDEKNPKLMGWFDPGPYFAKNPPKPPTAVSPFGAVPGCTAHHGRLVPDVEGEGKRDLLAMAFYGAGVALVDFTNPARPMMVDQFAQGTNTWEVWYYNGYLFTGDMARGLDVLTFR